MTMLLPLFILVGFIADYFVNAIAYHLSPLEDKTALTFRQVLVHFRQKKYAWHDTVPLILCVAAAIACALAPFTPIVTGALFLYFCSYSRSVLLIFALSSCPTNSPYRCSGLAWYLMRSMD